MTQSKDGAFEEPKDASLPRQNRILLPPIGLLTISCKAASAVLLARHAHLREEGNINPCLVVHDFTSSLA